jgi:trehalose synthase
MATTESGEIIESGGVMRHATTLGEFDPSLSVPMEEYEPYIGRGRVEDLRRLAGSLQGKRWINVNSTLRGGGVAEMLQSLVPLARGLGVDARWLVIPGSDEFFRITKTFHNLLQGMETSVPVEDIFHTYLEISRERGRDLELSGHMVEIHDPQPLAMMQAGEVNGSMVWRCHIDTSSPHPALWRLFLPYINRCAGAVFTMPEFVGPGLDLPLYQITPSIDPRAEKNRQYSRDEALSILEPLFQQHGVDSGRPILAAVSRYDVHKNQETILAAFKRLKETKRANRPYLIFLGNTASDDPEGDAVLASLRELAGDDPDVHFWVNVDDNDRVVGALMKAARAFAHVSTKEGFGLVVTEALWQGTPVIGSRVGGIKEQVIDEQTGYLVDPLDVEAIADRMERLLDHPSEATRLGAQGRRYVQERYLLPEMLRRYLLLLHFHAHEPAARPGFILSELALTPSADPVQDGSKPRKRPTAG